MEKTDIGEGHTKECVTTGIIVELRKIFSANVVQEESKKEMATRLLNRIEPNTHQKLDSPPTMSSGMLKQLTRVIQFNHRRMGDL
jgi:hypothetical protein